MTMTALQTSPAPACKPAPLAYMLLNASSHCPQTRDYLLKLAGLHFAHTSPTVRAWQDQLFDHLKAEGWLRQGRDGLYSLTVKGEDQLMNFFKEHGPLKLVKL